MDRGINHSVGEGGFWAKIVFKDTSYPTRYAFVRQLRMFDRYASPVPDAAFKGVNGSNPPGEQSVWNDPATGGNFTQAMRLDATLANIPAGRVLNWATEANGNADVPNGTIVWIRPGETYMEKEFGTPKDDYVFQFSMSTLLFGLTTGTVLTSDATFTVNNITIAQKGGPPTTKSTDTIIVNNWTGDWSCAAGGVKVMFALLDLIASYPSIGHGNFVQGPCPT